MVVGRSSAKNEKLMFGKPESLIRFSMSFVEKKLLTIKMVISVKIMLVAIILVATMKDIEVYIFRMSDFLAPMARKMAESLRLSMMSLIIIKEKIKNRIMIAIRIIRNYYEIGRACVGKECRSRWSPYH